MRKTPLLSLAFMAFTALASPSPGQSGAFAPAVIVNNSVVTNYELAQRTLFLRILRAPGDPADEARKSLIDEKLRMQAARDAGVSVSDEQIAAGMAEFASRANLTTDQFLQAIGQAGVDASTYRDFVIAGISWREVVRGRFGDRIAVSDADIARATSVAAQRGAGPRVLISEIIIPTTPSEQYFKRKFATELAQSLGSDAAFAEAARKYSSAPSREKGGQLGWIPLSNLPPQLRGVLGQLGQGRVSDPVPLGNAIVILKLRGVQEPREITPRDITVDYAEILLPGSQSAAAQAEAQRIRATADSCGSLYGAVKGTSGQLTRQTMALPQVPADVARELASLDDNEVSTRLTRGGALVFLMLCNRSATVAEGGAPTARDLPAMAMGGGIGGAPALDPAAGFGLGPSTDQVRQELFDQQLAGAADRYLAELRANADIRTP